MNTKSVLASLALALPALAQNDMGIEVGGGATSWITRTATAAQSACVSRYDLSDFAAMGFDASAPGVHVNGVSCYFYDFENAGTESFTLVMATGAPAANVPTWSSMVTVSAAITAPSAPGGFEVRVNFASPVVVVGGDVYVGGDIPAKPVTETNGLWLYTVRGTNNTPCDLGGPALDISTTTADTYTHGTLDYVTNLQFAKRYLLCDLNVLGAGGMATTITNQVTMTSSAVPPGIAGFYSGLHPDVNGFNVGRVDDPGYRYVDSTMAAQPVLFFISFTGFNPTPIPLSFVFPGSTGSWCLNDGVFLGTVAADASGVAFLNLALDAAARAAMGGSGLAAQMYAVGFDGTRLSGAPCANVVY